MNPSNLNVLHNRLDRLKKVLSSRNQEWKMHQDFVDRLRKDLACESSQSGKFPLEQQIKDKEAEIKSLEQILQEIEMEIDSIEQELERAKFQNNNLSNLLATNSTEQSILSEEMTYEYHIRGPLGTNDPTYVKRQADNYLFQHLKKGDLCCVFNSRQTGKSSLRVRTKIRLQAEGIACVDIAATEIITSEEMPQEGWYTGVIDSIIKDLGLNNTFNTSEWWNNLEPLPAVYRFSKFIQEVLLERISQRIVIFIDEIDRFLSLKFNLDSFFAIIREFYNKRADIPAYRRLTFALIGVATPSDLIRDPHTTPFNISRNIELTGFQFEDINPLAQGLAEKADNSFSVMKEILEWTGGQPFLTQKLCHLLKSAKGYISLGEEKTWVSRLVKSDIVENWSAQDDPQHLKTIKDRLLINESRAGRFLELYQQILKEGSIHAVDSPEQMHLRLSGLVVKQGDKLRVYNRIYEQVFNLDWISMVLRKIVRPYAQQIEAWKLSNYEDQSNLLYGENLKQVQKWLDNAVLSLSKEDYSFFAASTEFDQKVNFLPDTTTQKAVIEAVMYWTSGQKKLNETIFLILSREKTITKDSPKNWVEKIIYSRIIKKWETEPASAPLRKIRDKLLKNEEIDPFWLLVMYRKIFLMEGIEADNSKEQSELRKLRIILKKENQLSIANRIYKNVFDLNWVNKNLVQLRPYGNKLVIWLDSNCQDTSQLLSKKELEAAQKWSKGKILDEREHNFLINSMVWNT